MHTRRVRSALWRRARHANAATRRNGLVMNQSRRVNTSEAGGVNTSVTGGSSTRATKTGVHVRRAAKHGDRRLRVGDVPRLYWCGRQHATSTCVHPSRGIGIRTPSVYPIDLPAVGSGYLPARPPRRGKRLDHKCQQGHRWGEGRQGD